jgi:hypothetical protein
VRQHNTEASSLTIPAVEKQTVLNMNGVPAALVIQFANCIFSAPSYIVIYGHLTVFFFVAIIEKKCFGHKMYVLIFYTNFI